MVIALKLGAQLCVSDLLRLSSLTRAQENSKKSEGLAIKFETNSSSKMERQRRTQTCTPIAPERFYSQPIADAAVG